MYLSIDLDYWNHQGGIKSLKRVISAVRDSGKLRQICDNHKYLLKSIRASGQNHIVNVDTHSDLTDPDDINFYRKQTRKGVQAPPLNCGTWVNFIPKKLRNLYEWYYPSEHGERCDSENSEDHSIFNYPHVVGFNCLNQRPQRRFPMHLIEKASDIGISVSYYYLEERLTVESVKKALKDIFGRAIRQSSFDCW